MARLRRKPRCIIIAGPNGAGKTTFARRFLPENARVIHFVNADLIASGLSHVRRIQAWKCAGYRIEMVYLKLRSSRLALRRIAARVRQGGHDVPKQDVVRRFVRSWDNFERVYRPLADAWAIYDNSDREPQLLERGP